eukprot:gene476-316_t
MTKYQNLNNLSTTEFAYGTKLMDGSLNCVHEALPVEWTSCQWISTDEVECSSVNTWQPDQSTLTSADYYNRLDSFKLSFDLCNYVNSFGVNHDCHYWRVVVTFRSVSLMYIQATVATQLVNECEQSQTVVDFSDRPSNWINMLTIVLGVWYLIYVIQDIVESVRIYRAVKEAHRKAREIYLNKRVGEFVEHDIAAKYAWEEIPRGVKRSFHNYWSVFSLVAIVLAIIQACISLSDPYDDLENLEDGQKALVGIGVLFLWMAVIQFIPVQSPVYALAATIQTAFPRIFAFLLTFLPVFLAFVFFGIALFGSELGSFGSVDRAAKFIFTLMAGDSVMQIMQLMTKQSIWASLIFGITFTLVTAYLLVNIFISIVEEAYFIARKQGRYLELLMWRNLKTIAKSKHPDPGDMKDFDADVTTLVIAPNPTSKHSASLLGQLHELDKLTAAHDVSSQSVGDVPNMSRGEDKLRDTLTEQHQSRSYRALVRELLDATVPDSHLAERQGLQSDSLTITLAEETAEMYILGRNHWEYSKMMDFVAEQLDSSAASSS